jgi:hypothetical protein
VHTDRALRFLGDRTDRYLRASHRRRERSQELSLDAGPVRSELKQWLVTSRELRREFVRTAQHGPRIPGDTDPCPFSDISDVPYSN